MNFKEKGKEIKNWVKANKGKILLGSGLVTAIVIGAMIVHKPKTEKCVTSIELDPPKDFDCGKDLEMHFIDPENGNVLWKELCTESYMNDFKDCGMQYESVRKLNGIEEA